MTRARIGLLAAALAGSLCLAYAVAQTEDKSSDSRDKARQQWKKGNWKDCYSLYSKLALNKEDEPYQVSGDLQSAVSCLQHLGRLEEFDDFVEGVVAAHGKNWRLLEAAANLYNAANHNGYIVSGKFNRGNSRGGLVKFVHAYERDRIRALQLMQQAMDNLPAPKDEIEVLIRTDEDKTQKVPAGSLAGQFYLDFAQMLMGNRGYGEAWRLQYLTDLTKLPDYEEGYYYGYYGGGSRGAPVDEGGQPVYHYLPKSWKDAASDGQRWRWTLAQAMEYAPGRSGEIRFQFAQFCENQFGVQTMAEYGWFFGRSAQSDDDTRKDESGTWALHTLADDETIAKLANGIKRFKLPDEFNYLKTYKELADSRAYDEKPRQSAAQCYENRRQYVKAAEQWRLAIKEFGVGPNNWRQQRLDQIVGNWGQFEPLLTQPAGGQGATVDFRFRNGKKVSFEAHEIDVKKLLDDVKQFIKTTDRDNEWWQKANVADLGWRLVEKNQTQYLKEKVAAWDLELKPRPDHFDKRITVQTPLKKAGAYLLIGKMEDGNISRIIIWVADTVIVKKALDKQVLYYVADAVGGKPIAKANLEFFGYRQEWVNDPGNRGAGKYVVTTRDFAEFTDGDGMFVAGADNLPVPKPRAAGPAAPLAQAANQAPDVQARLSSNFQWLAVATTPEGRLAYLGFSGVWFNPYYDAEYNQTKVFTITDRPVYRPGNTVKFKFWVNTAKYDLEGKSEFAGQKFTVEVRNPKDEKVTLKASTFTADEYGGFDGELVLDKEATLGVYRLWIVNSPGNRVSGGNSFRVEEYKKPEFEVKVDAPADPVMLGEKVTAKVAAKYYFGAPVTQAKVHYKVLRSSYGGDWYPVAYWDWFYGPGYWWFACDYAWYPGWAEWGCRRPTPIWWWQWHPREQPELVAEGDFQPQLDKDGTFKLDIDTALAKAIHGNTDHRYDITVEVTDQSRRTIVGTGKVLVARKPFKVYAWVDRGFYRVGDAVAAHFHAQTLDGKPVQGKGDLRLLKLSYEKDGEKPVETEVPGGKWALDTNVEGFAEQQIKAAAAGQYRLSYKLTDVKGHTIEGGYVFVVRGEWPLAAGPAGFRFNDIELTPDKKEYKPGDKVELMVSTDRPASTVLLFLRPTNGVYLKPKVLRLADGAKTTVETVEVIKKDMPNFFIEGLTVSGAKVFTEVREIVVPPEKRVLDVKVVAQPPSAGGDDKKAQPGATVPQVKPGEKAKFTIKLTDPTGEPYSGSTVVALYDKAVEYISGGSNVPEIKEFYWKWRRHHHPATESSVDRGGHNITRIGELVMGFLGVFGAGVADETALALGEHEQAGPGGGGRGGRALGLESGALMDRRSADGAPGAATPMLARAAAAPAAEAKAANGAAYAADKSEALAAKPGEAGGGAEMVEPTVRQNFADTALWVAALATDAKGEATVEVAMPENLTTWKARVWAMGQGTKVGEGSAEVITTKNLIIRLEAPRFFVQKDEVVLSAIVHNYLKDKKKVKVALEIDELDGAKVSFSKAMIDRARPDGWTIGQDVEVPAGDEKRVDWLVRIEAPGRIAIRMKALTDEESDATQQSFPVFIHGMLKMDSFSGVIRPNENAGVFAIKVPAERLPEQSRLEIRYSPTLAGAMVDALPYMVDYPYGCTEQTLNRFLPTVVTQKMLLRMGLDLKDIAKKRTNLNAQEIGEDKVRAKDWAYRGGYMSRATATVKEPVFDEDEVKAMVKAGLARLGSMQCSDGGWGWFSGYGEQSWPHTTAVVVHGLQIARDNDVALVPGLLERGVAWLKSYQAGEVQKIKNWPKEIRPRKEKADNLDAFVYMVLVDEKADNKDMREFLFRDKNDLAVYAKAMFGLALHRLGFNDLRDQIITNIEQFLVQDKENQTCRLRLPANNYWWCWYGSEMEAQAFYLKLLAATDAKGEKAAGLVKFLINNRKNASYWNSTRDTSYVIEAFADYIRASGEDKPDMTVTVMIDGKQAKPPVRITGENLFSFDNKLVLTGEAVKAGEHKIELVKKGTGPLYFNAYLTNFTLEDPIAKAGLELKIERKFFKLVEVDKKIKVAGARGQAVDQKVEKYERVLLSPTITLNGAHVSYTWPTLKSGDLVEIELTVDSKNDYEYVMLEDMKAAGFEPVEVRSGYNGNDLGAYMELRDERVSFFVRSLPLGRHSVSYRLRAEIPGRFSALPAKGSAMYAPELKANSDEMKVGVTD